MSVGPSDIDAAHELFDGLGTITSRKMMGGLTLYADGALFATLDAHGRVYVKARGDLANRLAAEGSQKFTFDFGTGKGSGSMNYWTLPDAALDDPDLACDWARQALAAAKD